MAPAAHYVTRSGCLGVIQFVKLDKNQTSESLNFQLTSDLSVFVVKGPVLVLLVQSARIPEQCSVFE